MAQENIDKLNEFYKKYKSECLALRQWIILKDKNFSLVDALECIYKFADGKPLKMLSCIKQLTSKVKKYGRANTPQGADVTTNKVDITKNENGELEFFGFNSDFEEAPKGQHREKDNERIFKKDGKVNKTYKNIEDKLYDLGEKVRELFPNYDNMLITQAIQSIRKYASEHKINPNKVVSYLKDGKLTFNEKTYIIENIDNRKVIVITEEMANRLNDEFIMTEYKFYNTIKKFLHDLLADPVNAEVPYILQHYGYNRYKLINLLKVNKLLLKDEKILDKDENGEPKTATMKIKYKVPKKNFDRKLRNLYIKMFEKNVPNNEHFISEDGCCGVMAGGSTNAESSGQFSEPVFPMQRKTMYANDKNKEIEEDTTTTSVGNYQYDVPFVGDKETLSRNNGIGGSTSVNRLSEYLDKNMSKVCNNLKKAEDEDGYNWAVSTNDGKEIIKNEWMIHFSSMKNCINIASNGFKYNNDTNKNPEIATYRREKNEGNGYNYAYLASDVLQFWEDGGHFQAAQTFLDYLMNEQECSFVMFKGNGFRFYHNCDWEEQVVFNNIQPNTKVLVMKIDNNYCVMNSSRPQLYRNKTNSLKKGENGLSLDKTYYNVKNPKNKASNILYFSAEIEKVINWVMNNYEQYKNNLKY